LRASNKLDIVKAEKNNLGFKEVLSEVSNKAQSYIKEVVKIDVTYIEEVDRNNGSF